MLAHFWARRQRRWRRRGDAARDAGDWALAARCYGKHLEQRPEDVEIRVQLAHALKEQGARDKALAAYERAIEASADPTPIKRTRAFLLRDMGRLQEAGEAFAELHQDPHCRAEALSLGAIEPLRAQVLAQAPPNLHPVWLEIGDLVKYHAAHSNPSGIQRVIAECAERLLTIRDDVALVVIAKGGLTQEVSVGTFRRLVALSGQGGDVQAFARHILDSAPFIPPTGSGPGLGVLFTFGDFWTEAGFFTAIDDMRANGRKLVALIHDLIPITHPHFAEAEVADKMAAAFDRLRGRCDWMIGISSQTHEDILRCGHRSEASSIVRLCHEFSPAQSGPPAPGGALSRVNGQRFVLCVGTIEPRKNHEILLRLWRAYRAEGAAPPLLVLAGRQGWAAGDLIAEIDQTPGVLRLPDVSEEDLAALYRACDLTVFPSFVEGWGLPPGESLSCGKLCVASNAVADVSDALLTFDPNSLEDLRRVLDPLLFDPGALEDATAEARRLFAPRGWDEVAAEISQVITSRLTAWPPR